MNEEELSRMLKHASSTVPAATPVSLESAIMARVRSGEITLAQAQAELKKIQAKAQSIGLKTRAQAFNEG